MVYRMYACISTVDSVSSSVMPGSFFFFYASKFLNFIYLFIFYL